MPSAREGTSHSCQRYASLKMTSPFNPLPHHVHVHFIVVLPPCIFVYPFLRVLSDKLVGGPQPLLETIAQTPHVRQCWNGLRELAGRLEWEKRSGDASESCDLGLFSNRDPDPD
jgi:hypothetical protein